MLLGVKTEEAVNSQLKSIASGLKHYGEHNDILLDAISAQEDKVTFELMDADDATAMDDLSKNIRWDGCSR